MTKERAIFENLYCDLFVSDLGGEVLEGEAASMYSQYQGSRLAVESNSPKTYLSQVPIKTKQWMPDSILSFFSASRSSPVEVTRRNPLA